MSLLNSSLLLALAPLLALPLVIHFLNKRFPHRFNFSSVENLRKSAAERSRFYRWRHRILTGVRTLFLLLLLFVFLKPVLDRFGNASPKHTRQVLIIIDHSMSMEYQQGGMTTHARAVIEAEKILDTLGPNDSLDVIAAGPAPELCTIDFTNADADARHFLHTLPPGIARADFTQANIAAARLLANANGNGDAEIYYISNFQRKNWAEVDFQPLANLARVFFVDVGPESFSNHAVLGAQIDQSQVLAGDTIPLQIDVGNFSDAPLDAPVTVRIDQRLQVQARAVAGPWSTVKVTVPVPATTPGLHICEVMLPPDNLALDDRWTLILPVLEKEEVVTISENADQTQDPVKYLHAALNPYPSQAGSLIPHHVASAAMDASDLAAAQKIFITRCGPLQESAAQALAGFLERGGSIVWFLDSESDSANLALLEKAMSPAKLPLQVGPLRKTVNVASAAQQIATGDFNAKLLRMFRGSLRQDLGLLEFYDFHAASATGQGKVLLRFADETPAMAVAEHGLGTLVLMNFSVSEMSSNLARQRIFPAWIQELVKQLNTTETAPLAYVAGQMVESEVWRDDLRKAPIKSPSGRAIDIHQEPMGERSEISFPANELGLYTLTDGGVKYAFAVNGDPGQSDLRPVDKSHLQAQLAAGQHANFAGGSKDYERVAFGQPLLHLFLLGGLAVLLIELLLQLSFRRAAP
jgi:hypothetical protein